MLFTLDQEYEVKSLCETPGTKQKRFTQTQSNASHAYWFQVSIIKNIM